ncbi:MAG TPA: hypothetical protein ENN21_10415 [Spirochaetes bacterium]|nr:hypothetical protein [Spirochaetota bacterium]
MHDKIDINNVLLAAVFSVLGIIVPMIFHVLGLGAVFLPMYLPLAMGAFFLTAGNAVLMGIFTPFVSALITGMPPFYPPFAFLMMGQLGLFCVIISFMSHRLKTGVWPALLTAILADRLILVGVYYIIIPYFGINFGLYTAYDLLKGLPGIILMAVVVPPAVPGLKKIIQRQSLRLFEHGGTHTHETRLDK